MCVTGEIRSFAPGFFKAEFATAARIALVPLADVAEYAKRHVRRALATESDTEAAEMLQAWQALRSAVAARATLATMPGEWKGGVSDEKFAAEFVKRLRHRLD